MGTDIEPPGQVNARVRPPILIRDDLEDCDEMWKLLRIGITRALDKCSQMEGNWRGKIARTKKLRVPAVNSREKENI